MPQNNPSPATTSKSESASFILDGANFTIIGAGPNYLFQQSITIPIPFNSMEFVHDIQTVSGGAVFQLYYQARLTDDSISNISVNPLTFPSTIGGGGGSYPLVSKTGLGPAFDNVSPITPGGDIVGDADYLDMYIAGNANLFQGDLILSVPIVFSYVLEEIAGPSPPTIDGTVTYTFYR